MRGEKNMSVAMNRALRGLSIVHSNERYKNSNDNLGDVLLDLLHYAKREGKDFGKELAFALNAFVEDTCPKLPKNKGKYPIGELVSRLVNAPTGTTFDYQEGELYGGETQDMGTGYRMIVDITEGFRKSESEERAIYAS
jgi:hypothetical protein